MIVSLSDVAEAIDYGVTASASSVAVGPQFLRITDIQNDAVDWSRVPWCKCDAKTQARAKLKAGDIVFARTGATTGKSFLVKDCPEDSVFASYLIRVRISKDVEPRYISHYFRSEDYWAQISKAARGAAQLGVNATSLGKLKLPLPARGEQRRVADILDRAEALRAKRRATLALLDSLTQSIFLDLFGDPVVNEKCWPAGSLNEVCETYSGATPSKGDASLWEGALPWFSPKDMKREDLYESEDHLAASAPQVTRLRLLPANTVAIVVRGMILAHTFPVCMLRVAATINQDMKALIPKNPLNADFLAACLRAQAAHALAQVSEAGHGTKRLDAVGLSKIVVLQPPIELQERFSQQVLAVKQLRDRQHQHLRRVDELFASLQHRAFNGTL